MDEIIIWKHLDNNYYIKNHKVWVKKTDVITWGERISAELYTVFNVSEEDLKGPINNWSRNNGVSDVFEYFRGIKDAVNAIVRARLIHDVIDRMSPSTEEDDELVKGIVKFMMTSTKTLTNDDYANIYMDSTTLIVSMMLNLEIYLWSNPTD